MAQEAPLGWALLLPTSIKLRFEHEGQVISLRANLLHRPYAPLALRQLEVLEWEVLPCQLPPEPKLDLAGTSDREPEGTFP